MKNLETVILNVALFGMFFVQSANAQNNSNDMSMNDAEQMTESYSGASHTDDAKTRNITFKRAGDVVSLNLLNPDKEKIRLKVYDSYNNLLFAQTIENRLRVKKKFNFKDAYEDEYTVKVSSVNGTYSEKVVVN